MRRLLVLSGVLLAVVAVLWLARGPQESARAPAASLEPVIAHETPPEPAPERIPVATPEAASAGGAAEPLPAPDPERADGSGGVVDEPVPPGFLEGLVLRGTAPAEPVGGGEAWLVRGPRDGSGCAHATPGEERVAIGPDGRFRFAVAPGAWCLGVDALPGVRRVRAFDVRAGESVPRWIVRLGTGEIRGHVWDADGRAAGGVAVAFSGGRRVDGRWEPLAEGVTTSAPDGSYRLAELEAGTYGLEARLGAGASDPLDLHVFATELDEGETKTLDLGSELPLPLFSGRITVANGATVTGPSMTLLLDERLTRTRTQLRADADGLFRAALRPGRYGVRLQLLYHALDLDEIVVAGHDVESDLRLPGAWLRVDVRSDAPLDPQLMVVLAPRDGLRPRTWGQPGHDGRWHFLGLAPGEYEVWAERSGPARPPPETRQPLRVAGGEAEISLEIEGR